MKKVIRVFRTLICVLLSVAMIFTSFDVSVFAKDNHNDKGNQVTDLSPDIVDELMSDSSNIEYGQPQSMIPSDVVIFNDIPEELIDEEVLKEVEAYKEAFANGIGLEEFVLSRESSEENAEEDAEENTDENIENIDEDIDDTEENIERYVYDDGNIAETFDSTNLGHETLSINAVNYIYAVKNVDVKNNAHSIEHSHKPFKLVCDPGQSKEFISKYILYYDGKVIAESTTGEFENIDPKPLEIGKSFVVEAVGEHNSSCKITLLLTIAEDSKFNPQRLYLGGKEGFSLTLSNDVPVIGGKPINFSLPDLPISVILEDNVVKIGVNILEKNLYSSNPDANNEWNSPLKPDNIKNVFENYEEDVKKGDFLHNMSCYNFMNNRNLGASVPMVDKNITFSVAGYIEGAYCSDSISKLSGKIVIGVAGKVSSTWQYYVPVASIVIPVVITLDASVSGTLIGEISYDFERSEVIGFIGASATVSLDLFGGVGAGRWLSVGVYGSVSLTTDFNIISNDPARPSGCSGVYLYGEAGFQAWVLRKQYRIALVTTGDLRKKWPDKVDDQGRLILYKRSTSGASYAYEPVYDLESLSDDEQLLAFMDFETMASVSSSLSGGFMGTGVIVDDAYQGAAPQMVSAGGVTIIMFTDSDTTRPELDQSMVKYVIYDDVSETVSEMYPLDDDSTADASPMLYTDGNDIYCVYLNATTTFASDVDMDEYTSMFDVCVSRYDVDSNKFVSLGTVNSNTGMCYSPSIQFTPQGMVVMWVENENKTFMGLDNSNVIKTALYTEGGWLEENVVASNLNHVIDVDVAHSGEVAWVIDLDNDLQTQNHALYTSNGGRIYGNISDISYETLPGYGKESLVYCLDGGLFADKGDSVEKILESGTMDPIGGFSFYKNDLYFVKTGDEARNLMRAVKSDKDNKWYIGDNTGLVAGDAPDYTYVDSFSICKDKVVTLVSKSTPVTDVNGEVADFDVTSQIRMVNDERSDLELNNIQFENDDIFSDSLIPVVLTVTNEGSKVENGFKVKAGDYSEYVNCTIMPGETIDVQEYISSPDNITISTDVDVEIISDDNIAPDEDCIKHFDINVSDIDVELTYAIDKKVHVVITNDSSIDGTFDYSLVDYKDKTLDTKSGISLDAYDSVEYIVDVTPDRVTGVMGVITADGIEKDTDYCKIDDFTAVDAVVTEAADIEEHRTYSDEANTVANYLIEQNGDVIVSTDEAENRILGKIFDDSHKEMVKTVTFCDDITSIDSTDSLAEIDSLERIVVANKECTISEGVIPSGAVLCGYYGSEAYDYAISHNIEFDAIDETFHTHKWGSGVDEILATFNAPGKRVYTCEYCKEQYVRELDAKGVVGSLVEDKNAEIIIDVLNEGEGFEYTGKAIVPQIAVYDKGYRLHEGTDYTVRFTNNINVGLATAYITGKGNYSINDKINYSIIQRDISKSNSGIVITAPDMKHTGREAKSIPVVSMNGKNLTVNKDYTVQYIGDITSLGIATLQITGNDNYTGVATATYRIYNSTNNINSVYVEDVGTYTYTGEVIKPVFKVKASRNAADYLTEGEDYEIECSSINAGNAIAYIKGKGVTYGTYGGMKAVSFKIEPKDIAGVVVSVDDSVIYNGKGQKPTITVKDETTGEVITSDCYSLTYSNNVEAVKATDQKAPAIKIAGKKNYKGSKIVNFTINPVSVYGNRLSVVINPVKNAGREITAKDLGATVKFMGKTLKRDRDYTISFTRVPDKSIQTAKLIFKGNYAGTVLETFRIYTAKEDAQSFEVSIADTDEEYYYSGEKITPKVVVTKTIDGAKVTLKEGVDYKVTYSNNVKACDKTAKNAPTIKVTGLGMYSGVCNPLTFTIKPLSIFDSDIETVVKDIKVNKDPVRSPLKPGVTVINKITGKKLSKAEYSVEYLNNTAVSDSAIARIKACGNNYEGSMDMYFRIYENEINSVSIDKIADMCYTGLPVMPRGSAVKVYADRQKTTRLTEGVDYTLTYGENIMLGTGTVTITGKGTYGGSMTVKFKIVPRTVK